MDPYEHLEAQKRLTKSQIDFHFLRERIGPREDEADAVGRVISGRSSAAIRHSKLPAGAMISSSFRFIFCTVILSEKVRYFFLEIKKMLFFVSLLKDDRHRI